MAICGISEVSKIEIIISFFSFLYLLFVSLRWLSEITMPLNVTDHEILWHLGQVRDTRFQFNIRDPASLASNVRVTQFWNLMLDTSKSQWWRDSAALLSALLFRAKRASLNLIDYFQHSELYSRSKPQCGGLN